MTNRSMVKLIHADGFFPDGDAERYCNIVKNLSFVETDYGLEIPNFNMILSGIEPTLSKVVGERVIVDSKKSGIFRRPLNNLIHFEAFESLNEWCFIIALEKTTLNLWYHLKNPGDGEIGEADAWSALDGWQYNYRNLLEWNIHTNIILRPNQGVFFRPWVFHSLEDGIVQYYRLISDRKFRILVMGLPGSGRDIVSKKLNDIIDNSYLLKSRHIRENLKDVDFSYDGRLRQTYRLLSMARERKEDCVIIDMVCPLPEMREILNPDLIIWVDDINSSTNKELNEVFVPPKYYDVKFSEISDKFYKEVLDKIESKKL